MGDWLKPCACASTVLPGSTSACVCMEELLLPLRGLRTGGRARVRGSWRDWTPRVGSCDQADGRCFSCRCHHLLGSGVAAHSVAPTHCPAHYGYLDAKVMPRCQYEALVQRRRVYSRLPDAGQPYLFSWRYLDTSGRVDPVSPVTTGRWSGSTTDSRPVVKRSARCGSGRAVPDVT